MIRNNRHGYLLLYGLAYGGAVCAYVPLLTLLLPLKVESIAEADGKVALLTLASIAGALAASVSNILAGMISDRWAGRPFGRRAVAAAGLSGTALSYVALHLASSPGELVAAVVLFQAALNTFLSPLIAIAADETGDDQKGVLGGVYGAAYPLGTVAAVMVTWAPDWSWAARLFCTLALVTALAAPFLLITRRPAAAEIVAAPAQAAPHGFWRLGVVGLSRLLVQVAGNVLFAFILFYFQSVAEPGGAASGESLAGRVAWITGVVTLVSAPVSVAIGRLIARLGRGARASLAALACACATGLAVMGLWPQWTAAVAGYALFAIGLAAFLAIQSAYAMRLLPSSAHRGRDLGLLNLTNTLPALLGPALTYLLAAEGRFGPLLLLLALLSLAAGGLMMLGAAAPRRHDPQPGSGL